MLGPLNGSIPFLLCDGVNRSLQDLLFFEWKGVDPPKILGHCFPAFDIQTILGVQGGAAIEFRAILAKIAGQPTTLIENCVWQSLGCL